MTFTTLSIISDIQQNFANFFDVVVDYLRAIHLVFVGFASDVVILIRLAWNFITIPTFLSGYFIAPVAISGAFMVIVGIVKLIFGRDSQ